MRVGLYDIDSKIPNLALMKISAWHKALGHQTELWSPITGAGCDIVYASKVFDYSSNGYVNPNTLLGGTGSNTALDLPQHVEQITPDYLLYGWPHNMGFASRGCRLSCDFCVVPKKEGAPRRVASISDLWTQHESKFLILLDNDILGAPHFDEICDQIEGYDLAVNVCQGINARTVTEHQAQRLARLNTVTITGKWQTLHFAWDQMRHERTVMRGIWRLVAAGIRPTNLTCFVLIGFDTTEDEDLYRVEKLRSVGVDPYAMPYNKLDRRQMRFARWVNHKAIFRSTSWRVYGGSTK